MIQARIDVALTVLLATRNGEAVLPRMLEAYRRIQPPTVPWKMLIVDNASTDATAKIIESFRAELPLEMLCAPLPGKSRALNGAIPALQGKLIVFTDDDTIPHPSFLAAWEKILHSKQDYELFGGIIEPLFDSPLPGWMLDMKPQFSFMFGERDLPEGPIDPGEIYGANMAVRASVFDRGFRFDEHIGPNALDPAYPMGNETEFCRRVASLGAKSWFAREPRVDHIVHPGQFTNAAWAERAYRTGRGRAYQMLKRGDIPDFPAISAADRLARFSPMARHRLKSLYARSLAQGFRDECARQLALAAPPAPGR